MATKNSPHAERFGITLKDLSIPEDRRKDLEAAVDQMAEKADFLGYLDPLDAEPAVCFDPAAN